MPAACKRCLARSWLLARLAGHLDRVRSRIESALELDDQSLIEAVAGRDGAAVSAELRSFDARAARATASRSGIEQICRCDERFPARLLQLGNPPAVLHVAGGLMPFLDAVEAEPVAVVGSRRASPYALEVARSLSRSLAAAGLAVISGMALGVDSAAHEGALDAAGQTVAVLPGGADRAYPPGKRALYRRIVAAGAAVSELPPGAAPRRWAFPARNRIIAALSAMTVVVEASKHSGALVTARIAGTLGRPVGAVPGRVTSPGAAGTNALLAEGHRVIRDGQDVLDELFGASVRLLPDRARRPPLTAELERLLEAVAAGHDTPAALERAGFAPASSLAAIAALELAGYLRREQGGRYTVRP